MSDAVKVLVLVADDDEGIRDTTAAILRAVGCTVAEAPDGDAALAELAQTAFDVMILDVRMPVRDGISVVQSLDPGPPPPGVVLMSAYTADSELRELLGGRVCRYLKKPVPPNDLIDALTQAASFSKAQAL